MPNAKEVFFMRLMGLPTPPPPSSSEVKNTSFLSYLGVFIGFYEGGGFAPALVVHRKPLKNNTLSKI